MAIYNSKKEFTSLSGEPINFGSGRTFKDAIMFALEAPVIDDKFNQPRPLSPLETMDRVKILNKISHEGEDVIFETAEIDTLKKLFSAAFFPSATIQLFRFLDSAKA